MSRIPYPDPNDAPEALRPLLAGQVNVFRMSGHSPEIFALFSVYAASLLTHTALSDKHRELLILFCARTYSAPYAWRQHLGAADLAGITPGQVAAVATGTEGSREFTEAQHTLLVFADAAARGPSVSDEILGAVRRFFSDREIVETLMIIGSYFTIARISTVFDIEVDPAGNDQARWFWKSAEGLVDSLVDQVARRFGPQ